MRLGVEDSCQMKRWSRQLAGTLLKMGALDSW